ncbi:hypothetical protein NC653_025247 [Populus alba x Populus x berolinensis]|uniref:Acyl-ACP thioesterase-like C-terminal domain-containing protein n=1 Tax=Populus alba x Populus x berolinensis TaxID=444605 RepID=A0AAD6MBM8_9ROSI|nr:hypothetical protein NC653_025247 [Populus alba x Populus x berolinensis]
MELKSGFLSLENFKAALSKIQRQPKQECIKEYKSMHESFPTSDYYAQNVCLWICINIDETSAFQHHLQSEIICSTNNRGHSQSIEFRQRTMEFTSDEFFQGNCTSFAGYKRFIAGSAADNLRNDAFAYSSISSVLEHFEKEIRVPLQGRMECGETGSYEAKRQAMSLHVQQEKTRRLSKMPEEVRAEISPWFIEKLAIHEDVPEKISKLDSNAKYVNSNLKPKRSDLVMNQHVNNVKYVRWMLETIPDQFLESHQLSGIILEYRRECGSSNIVQSLCEPDEDGILNSVQSLCEPAEDGILNSGLKQNNDMSPLNRFSLASEIM